MQSGRGRHGHSLGCSPHSPPAVWLEELAEVAGQEWDLERGPSREVITGAVRDGVRI